MDLILYETGNGGDLTLTKNDLGTTDSLFNQVYMALFGGNYGATTTGEEIPQEQRRDYWANEALFANEPSQQFNSETEQLLDNTVLNSPGCEAIENAAKRDLEYLQEIANLTVECSIIELDKVEILVIQEEPNNIENKQFRFIWDATKKEVITHITL